MKKMVMSHQFQKVKLSDVPLSETIVHIFSWWFRELLYECHQDLEKSVSSLCDLKDKLQQYLVNQLS